MNKVTRELFEAIGMLFYAIAPDQGVGSMSFGLLKMLVHRNMLQWQRVGSESSRLEEVHIVMLTIDLEQGRGVGATRAFDQFANYYLLNQTRFDDRLKTLLRKTTNDIVAAFPSGQESRNNRAVKLDLLLEKASLVSRGMTSTSVD